PKSEPVPEFAVPLDVGLLQVSHQPLAPADQQQQATTAVVVLFVHLQVLGEVSDPFGEDGDLDLGRTSVALVGRVLLYDLGFGVRVERHDLPCLRSSSSAPAASSRHTELVTRLPGTNVSSYPGATGAA